MNWLNNYHRVKNASIFSETIFDLAQLNEQIRQIEAESELDSFWENNPNAQKIFQTLSQLKRKRDNITAITTSFDDAQTGLDLLSESPDDEDILSEVTSLIESLTNQINHIEIPPTVY